MPSTSFTKGKLFAPCWLKVFCRCTSPKICGVCFARGVLVTVPGAETTLRVAYRRAAELWTPWHPPDPAAAQRQLAWPQMLQLHMLVQ